jgi:hypothetical protein
VAAFAQTPPHPRARWGAGVAWRTRLSRRKNTRQSTHRCRGGAASTRILRGGMTTGAPPPEPFCSVASRLARWPPTAVCVRVDKRAQRGCTLTHTQAHLPSYRQCARCWRCSARERAARARWRRLLCALRGGGDARTRTQRTYQAVYQAAAAAPTLPVLLCVRKGVRLCSATGESVGVTYAEAGRQTVVAAASVAAVATVVAVVVAYALSLVVAVVVAYVLSPASAAPHVAVRAHNVISHRIASCHITRDTPAARAQLPLVPVCTRMR